MQWFVRCITPLENALQMIVNPPITAACKLEYKAKRLIVFEHIAHTVLAGHASYFSCIMYGDYCELSTL
jgi:hypothetical protein